MNWWLRDNQQDQVAPLATRPQSTYWERVGAGYTMSRIEDDSWSHGTVLARDYEDQLTRMLPKLGPEADTPINPRGNDFISGKRRRARLFERATAFVAQNPETRGQIPTSEDEFQAKVLDLRKKEAADQQAVLGAAPDRSFGAETLGRLGAGATDPVTLATIPLSFVGGPTIGIARTVAAEAAIGAGSEALIAPRRQQTAQALDLPEPNPVADIAMAGLTSGVLAGGGALIGRGVQRYAAYRHERGLGTDASAPDAMSAGRYEGDVTSAETALSAGRPMPQQGPDAPPGWAQIRNGIFAGESGGDHDALYAFSNRAGGPFQSVKVSQMTVDQAIQFSAPGGDYARWVKGRIGRTATPMGAYQIVGDTLRSAKKAMGLTGDEMFDDATQERIAQWIMKTQGTDAWSGYRGPRDSYDADLTAPYGGRDFTGYTPTSRGYTGRGQIAVGDRRIDVDYQVVDAASLRAASGRYQPRDRSRANSDAWISDTAARLDPAQLMPSPTADRGTPIVGPDDMVESGNGRLAAIQRAYDQHPDRAAAYRQQIEAAGFDVPDGVSQPVLIARRRTALNDAEREQLTVDAQDGGVARMTPTEIAQTSARAMTASRMATLRPEAALSAPENGNFLRSVLAALPRSERNALFDDAGALNAEGKRRMAQAFFARAWDDGGALGRDALQRYAELENAGDLKSLMSALETAAPHWAAMRAEIEAGIVKPEFDITPQVLDALHVIALARRDASRIGGTVSDAIQAILDQGDMFSTLNPLSVALLRKFWRDGKAAPADEVSRFLTRYADEARTAGRSGDMMGASPADVLRRLDARAFADLPDDIPPLDPPPAAPVRDGDMPETAFRDGADSPEAETGDAQARADFDDVGFGPVIADLQGQPKAAIARLMADQTGEVINAVTRDDLGGISIVYGNSGMGLRHIAEKHPEIVDRLPDLLEHGTLVGRIRDRAYLQLPGEAPASAVIRLDWDGKDRTWLVTAFDDDQGQVARQLRMSNEPAASASSRIPDATGQGKDSPSALKNQGAAQPVSAPAADDDISRAIAAARAGEDFELPDGRMASDVLRDLDDDDALNAAINTCLLEGPRT